MKHLRAILLLPGMAAVVVPGTILLLTGLDTLGLWQSIPATRFVLPVLGAVFIALFVTVGQGTLAPWDPTQRLVLQGVYRHVRNPMIAGVFFVLLGEALLAASLPLFSWFVVFFIGNAIYIPLAEEPGLVKRFGEEYLAYNQNVPKWIPRLTAWDGPGHSGLATI